MEDSTTVPILPPIEEHKNNVSSLAHTIDIQEDTNERADSREFQQRTKKEKLAATGGTEYYKDDLTRNAERTDQSRGDMYAGEVGSAFKDENTGKVPLLIDGEDDSENEEEYPAGLEMTNLNSKSAKY